jgi:hypothetical protein
MILWVLFNSIFLFGIAVTAYHYSRKKPISIKEPQDLRAIKLLRKIYVNNESSLDLDTKIINDGILQKELEELVLIYDKESKMNVKTLGNVTFLMEYIAVSKKAS